MPWEPPAAAFTASKPSSGWEPPKEAFAEKRSVGQRALTNLPSSAVKFAQNIPAMNGGPIGSPNLSMGEDGVVRGPDGKPFKQGPSQTWEDLKNAGSALGRFIEHPIDTITESFAEDPINTVAMPAALVAGGTRALVDSGVPQAGAAVAKGAAKAGGRDIAVGAAKVAGGALVDAAGAPYHVGTLYGIKEGIGDIARGGKAAIEGGKAELDKFRALQQQAQAQKMAAHPMAAPASTSNPLAVKQPMRPAPQNEAPLAPAPSGGMPTKLAPVISRDPTMPAETPQPSAAVAADPLDAIAAEIGYKKPYSKLTASQQMEVKIAQKAAAQAAEKTVVPEAVETAPQAEAPAVAPNNLAFEDAYNKALARLKASGEVPQEFERGTHGGPDPDIKAFDTGSGGPMIDSSKSKFRAPVANPQLLKPEQLTQHIERLSKKPNRTPGETNLLNQLRDEVKKRPQQIDATPRFTPDPVESEAGLASAIAPRLRSKGLVDDLGEKTLEMMIRRLSLTEGEVAQFVKLAGGEIGKPATGKAISDVLQGLPSAEREALNSRSLGRIEYQTKELERSIAESKKQSSMALAKAAEEKAARVASLQESPLLQGYKAPAVTKNAAKTKRGTK